MAVLYQYKSRYVLLIFFLTLRDNFVLEVVERGAVHILKILCS